jgi:hypothetical protein
MARPRSYHQDRALTGAERARAFRERRKLRNETSSHPQRNETADRNVTKSRNETADRNVTKSSSVVAPSAVAPVAPAARKLNALSPSVTPSPKRNATTPLPPLRRGRHRAKETSPGKWGGTDGEKLIQLVDATRKASGRKLWDAICTVLAHPDLPDAYKGLDAESLRKGYYKASKARQTYAPWLSLVRQWGGEPEIVDELIAGVGPNRAARIGELFHHLERQWRWQGKRKLDKLRAYRDGMLADPLYWPKLRAAKPRPGDAEAAEIRRLVQQRWPRSKEELMRRLRKSSAAVNNLTVAMCRRGEIERVSPGNYGPPGSSNYAPASRQIIACLIDGGEMTRTALQKSIGRSPTAIDKAIFSLRQSGVLAPPVRGPVSLSSLRPSPK